MPAVLVDTSRFGAVDVADDAVLEFPAGLIGLGGARYALIPHGEESPFQWLQSLDDPELALPVTDPFAFFGDYGVDLSDDDTEKLGAASAEDVRVLVTVSASGDAVTANLKAPIVVHGGRAFQVINEAPGADVRRPLLGDAATGG